ncbi:MAG TPA: APC family permease [Actinocrinis sp.]|nr:APC family permease [Actinocrinis sp.]
MADFKRDLGYWQLTAIGLGGVIGSGWLLGGETAAKAAGPASLITWVLGGLALLIIALVMVELGATLPRTGGLVRWPFLTSGRLVATLVGWGIWIAYATNPPSEAAAMLQYSSAHVHGIYSNGSLTALGILVAAVLMAVLVLLNWFSVLLFARVNAVVTAMKFIVPIATVICLGASGFHSSAFTEHGGFAPSGYSASLSAIATAGIIYAYTGFQGPIDLAGEARNPKRDIPRAVVTALLLSILLYVALELVFVGTVSVGSNGWSGIDLSSPYAQIAVMLNLSWFSWVLYADSVVSPGGSALVFTAETSREVYALSQNGFLPAQLRVLHRTGVPQRALVVNYAIGLAFLLSLHSWHKIVAATSVLGLFAYSVTLVSQSAYARAYPERRARWIPGTSVLAPIGFALATLIFYWAGWGNVKIAMPVLLVAVAVYGYQHWREGLGADGIRRGAWLVGYLVLLLVLSPFGSFGGDGKIRGPWDSVIVAAIGFAAYFAGVYFAGEHLREFPIETEEDEDPQPDAELAG